MVTVLFWVTIAAVALLVIALAVTLLRIVAILVSVRRSAGRILSAVRTIARGAEPIDETMTALNTDLLNVLESLRGLEEAATGERGSSIGEASPAVTPGSGSEGAGDA